MNLKEYLTLHKLSIFQFASMIDYNYVHLVKVINGQRPVTKKLARAIERVTFGSVTYVDLVKKEPENFTESEH
jgi:hypothetical protein